MAAVEAAGARRWITYDGMMDRRHMHSYLVGASAFQLHLKKCAPLARTSVSETGYGPQPPTLAHNSHALPVARIAANRRVYHAFRHRHLALDQRQVTFDGRVSLHLRAR